MILEDKIIYAPEDDELKRANLVRIMADSILSRCSSSHGPVTFGVLGAWGEGKTSFMRMVQTSLQNSITGATICEEPFGRCKRISSYRKASVAW